MLRWLVLLVCGLVWAEEPKRPNILFVLVDDLGFGNVDFTSDLFSQAQTSRVFKPSLELEWRKVLKKREVLKSSSFISSLAKQGRVLTRHYVHCTCSPSRASLQTGRLPVHVQMTLLGPCQVNSGVPVNMTCVAERMTLQGYSSHFVGKWDAGMAYTSQLPVNRGFQTSLNYFSHGNWMWSEDAWVGSLVNASAPPICKLSKGCAKDLWDTHGPAVNLVNTEYEEALFRNRLVDIIHQSARTPDTPLFLMYCPRVAHYPLQAPREYQDRFGFIPHRHRKVYTAMIAYLDDALRTIVRALQRVDRWENTLLVFTTDNGGVVKTPERCVLDPGSGSVCFNGEAGANNFPLRGGKYTMWEGGIRAATFVSGGVIPKSVRGRPVEEMMHIADWFATLQAFAGLPEGFVDPKAKQAGMPPIDSINFRDAILGSVRSPPRRTILLNSKALIKDQYKLLLGLQFGANWPGPLYPNLTTLDRPVYDSVKICKPACLFDVVQDPLESVDLARELPEVVLELQQELDRQVKTIWNRNTNPVLDPQCYLASREKWHGFWGPYKDLRLDHPTIA